MHSSSPRPPWQSVVLRPPPWTPLLVAARWWVRYGPGTAVKQRLLREWLDVGLRQRPRPPMIVRTRHGLRFQIPTTLDFIARTVYIHGCWEPCLSEFLAARLHPGAVFIDIGAAGGWHTLLAAHLVGDTGAVVAVEPAPAAQQQLRANLALNGFGNVRVETAAVATEPGKVSLYVPDSGNAGATTTIRPDHYESEVTVPGLPLTGILHDDDLARARIIKIDVEGAEATVLTALAPLILRLRHDCEILVEVTPRWLATTGHTAEQLLEPFTNNGFRAFVVHNSYQPQNMPGMLRHPAAPAPLTGPITRQTDLLLSRIYTTGHDRASTPPAAPETDGRISEALGWLRADPLTAQRALNTAELPADVPRHIEVLDDILRDDHKWTIQWRTTVANAVLTARDTGSQ
ncbi:FkbM family methyltransferase [Nocardia wallacei]|uniref:FkbM family methyltransferase n=1 Tax=Nocardia wallacei TaxID=480035 RepID=UPI002458E68B|nr:FkbM family methyltransferase [Nocardia wallacei]